MDNKNFILNFAPTGLIPTKDMTSHVPVIPAEVVDQVLEVAEMGVTMVHLHARDPQTGRPTYKKEIYGEIISAIRERNRDLIVSVSTSGRNFTEFDQRADCLKLSGDAKPDFASLTLSSLNFNKQASVNTPQMIQDLAATMFKQDIRPELEVFDVGMINYAKYLIKKGLINPPFYFNLILGNIACAQADLLHLGVMLKELPEGSLWSLGGVGDYQLRLNIIAIATGGGVRTGLEDNIWFDQERTKLASNRALIERIVTIARAMGCVPYHPQEARALLNC